MTANELADYITVNEIRTVTIDMVANMLRQQQAEIEKLGSELDRIVELYTDKAIENEALKKARCVACGWNPNLIGGEK